MIRKSPKEQEGSRLIMDEDWVYDFGEMNFGGSMMWADYGGWWGCCSVVVVVLLLRLYQVVEINRNSGSVRCQYVQFDGSIFGMTRTSLYINHFDGARSISDLSVYPISFHPDLNLEKRLAERERKTLDFQGICYREYSGVGREESYDDDDIPTTTKYHVSAHRHTKLEYFATAN